MSSPDHPTANLEDVFSSNFPNYVPPASPDYIPTSPGKTYSSASNTFGIVPLTSPTLSLFPDDPYMKALQAFYTEKSPIPSPIIIPPKTLDSFSHKTSYTMCYLHHTPSQPQLLRWFETSWNQLSNVIKRNSGPIQVVQTTLAFPKVLVDMENLQLASLLELSLCETQLVVEVAIPIKVEISNARSP
ncbi:hypothetical protein Tco_1326510 [Tanacetum coccineum]